MFSWVGLLLLLPGNYVFGSLGVNLAYHRILTHRSLEVPRWLERVFTIFGVCSLQGSPLRWVTTHRIHHQYSDEQEDPHSPLVTFLWGHMSWLFIINTSLEKLSTYERYSRDLIDDPFQRWLHRNYHWLWVYAAHALAFAVLCLGIGWLTTETVGRDVPDQHEPVPLARRRADGLRLAHHLAGQLGGALLGLPQLQDPRREPEQLVRRPADQRRGLAQQPPRLAAGRRPRAPLVGGRSDVLVDRGPEVGRAGVEGRAGQGAARRCCPTAQVSKANAVSVSVEEDAAGATQPREPHGQQAVG